MLKMDNQEKTTEEIKQLMEMSLYEYISGEEDMDLTMFTNLCMNNLDTIDINLIYRGKMRLQKLLLCFREITIESVNSNGHSDPYFVQSSSSNVCNIQ